MLQVAAPPTERIHHARLLPRSQSRQQNSHPPFTLTVTRPPSSSSESPGSQYYGSAQLPALAALASLAANAPAAPVKREGERLVGNHNGLDKRERAKQEENIMSVSSGYNLAMRSVCGSSDARHLLEAMRARSPSPKPKPRAVLAKPSSVCRKPQSTDNSFCYSRQSQSPETMSQPQPQYAPAATAGGQQNGPVSCYIPSAVGAISIFRVIRYPYR